MFPTTSHYAARNLLYLFIDECVKSKFDEDLFRSLESERVALLCFLV